MNSTIASSRRAVSALVFWLAGVLSLPAAVSVGPAGAGPLSFAAAPTVADGWSTLVLTGASTDVATAAALDAAVGALAASSMTTPVGSTATTSPSISAFNIPRWNSTLQLLQTVPTSTAYTVLLATLRNDSGGSLTQIRISYVLDELHAAGTTVAEEIPGHRVYWSPTGSAGTWQVIPGLSSVGTPGTLTAVLNLGSWAAGAPLYLLWADDNAAAARDNAGTEDGGYTIDNFTVSLSTQGVVITAPADGQSFVSGAPITVSADATLPGSVNNVQFRANGSVIANDATAPYGLSYTNAPLGTNILLAIATDTLGNSQTSAPVRIVVNPNQPPTVTLINPGSFEYLTASNSVVSANATDPDGSVSLVRFYDGTNLLGADAVAPYLLRWTNLAPGTHVITAVATDNAGLMATSPPVTARVVLPPASLVPFGAAWRYLDTGVDLGAAGALGSWTDFLFDDSGWSNGVAELGYGEGDEATTVRYGNDPNNKHITTYFRHRFNLANPNSLSTLGLRLRVDDGLVVYLNNQVLFSYNLPAGPGFRTLATAATEDDPVVAITLPVDGINVVPLFENILAVEVHQSATNTSDLSFDLELTANPVNTTPVVNINAPTGTEAYGAPATVSFNVSAYDLDGGITNLAFFDNGAPIGSFVSSYFLGTLNNVGPGLHTFLVLATDNSGLTATSAVTILVGPRPLEVTFIPTNSIWSFLDDGTDPGPGWQNLSFPAADGWSTGQAEFGYGDGDEVTVVNYGPDGNNKFVTTYFRHTFTVASTNGFTNVQVRLRRDDGAIVYVNGTEVLRSNMPLGPIGFMTLAGANTGSETAFNLGNFSPALLVPGQNVVAVEVHQNALNSSDMSFELELAGQSPPPSLRLQLDAMDPALLHLSWAPVAPGYQLQESPTVGGPWTTSASQLNPQQVRTSAANPRRFYRLVAP